MEELSDVLKTLYELTESSQDDGALAEKLSDYHEADVASIYPLLRDRKSTRLNSSH